MRKSDWKRITQMLIDENKDMKDCLNHLPRNADGTVMPLYSYSWIWGGKKPKKRIVTGIRLIYDGMYRITLKATLDTYEGDAVTCPPGDCYSTRKTCLVAWQKGKE